MRGEVSVLVSMSTPWLHGFCDGSGRDCASVRRGISAALKALPKKIKEEMGYARGVKVKVVLDYANCRLWRAPASHFHEVTISVYEYIDSGGMVAFGSMPTWVGSKRIRRLVYEAIGRILHPARFF